MKKIIPIVSLAVFLAACDSKTKDADKLAMPVTVDTTGYSEFQDWKAMNERVDRQQPEEMVQYAAPVKRKTYRPAPRAVEPTPAVAYPAPPVSTGERTSTTRDDTPDESTVATTGNGTENTTGAGTEAEKPAEKTGISKAAKGAIIGGVGGAAAGAILNKKNRAAGAVIGGVIGAGGGYVLGRKMDKKDGRY